MKLPSGQQPPTTQPRTAPGPAQPHENREGQPVQGNGRSARDSSALSAQQQLNQLRLGNREATLARVAEIVNRQGSSELMLEVRGKPLPVNAAIGTTKLAPGDWVKVMRAGNELHLMGKLAATPEAALTSALAQRLPWQQSLDGGLAKLMTALHQGVVPELAPGQLPANRSLQPLPEAARQALETLLARLPASSTLKPGAGTDNQTAQLIRQWVAESGLFAESRLSQTPSAALPDLKLAIGRVINSLLTEQGGDVATPFNRLTPAASPGLTQAPLQFPQTPPPPPSAGAAEPTTVGQTLRMLAGMLNRITVNQLHSQILTARAGGEAAVPTPVATLLLELPWVTPQNEPRLAQLRMEQYQDGSDAKGDDRKPTAISEWRLNLAIDLELAGALNFEVFLRQQEVSARVWAEKQETLKQVNEELPLLRSSLAELGLEVTGLECRRGSPAYPATTLEHRLVDTRA